MKVYVDELPKSCRECPCSIYDELDCCWCKAINGELTYITDNDFESKRLNSCPLQSLADYTKQVRKEVCEEIKEKIIKRFNGVIQGHYSEEHKDGYSHCCSDIEYNILDQIQGE